MGKKVFITITGTNHYLGDEFLKKWEGRDKNGEIDTIPEMFDAARGISDDETIHEHTDEQIEDKLEEDAATDADIDEMF